MIIRTIRSTTIAALAFVLAAQAQAHGALAVATLNDDVATNGFAVGWAMSYDTLGDAKHDAVMSCLSYTEVTPEVRINCKVVATLRNQCFALAMDPQPGTLGWGWAVGADKSSASSTALGTCKGRAEAERKGACVVTNVECDSTPDKVVSGQAPNTLSGPKPPTASAGAAGKRRK